MLDENGNVCKDEIGVVESASKQAENSHETNMFLRGLLETLQTKSLPVCPQIEKPSVLDELNKIISKHETSFSQKIVENTVSTTDIINSEPWKFRARTGQEPEQVFSTTQLGVMGVFFSRE